MKQFCFHLLILLLLTQGTVLSMMHTKRGVLRLKLNRKVLYGTMLKDDIRDAAFLRNQSLEDVKILLRNIENKIEKQNQLLQNLPNNLMTKDDVYCIRQAYIGSIYKVARIEAMCKIYATPNLEARERDILLNEVPRIVRE